jgi:hypothetical protein
VVHIPIDDRHPLALLVELLGDDGDVVEDAEAEGTVAVGVVSGRPDRQQGIATLPRLDGGSRSDSGAGGAQRGLPRRLHHGSIGIEHPTAVRTDLGDLVDIRLVVHESQVRSRPHQRISIGPPQRSAPQHGPDPAGRSGA